MNHTKQDLFGQSDFIEITEAYFGRFFIETTK
jgi:hypothetical protein